MLCIIAKCLSSDLAAANTLLCMLEGMFGLWIGVLESMKCLTIILNVRYLYTFSFYSLCEFVNVTLLEFFWGICVSFTFNWYLSKKTSLLWCLDRLSFFFWVSRNYFIKEKISNPKILLRNLMLELGIHHHQGSLVYESLWDSLMCIL